MATYSGLQKDIVVGDPSGYGAVLGVQGRVVDVGPAAGGRNEWDEETMSLSHPPALGVPRSGPGGVCRCWAVVLVLALAVLVAGCGSDPPDSSGTVQDASVAGSSDAGLVAAGAGVYQDVCSNCHGAAGHGSEWAPSLTTLALDADEVVAQVTVGNPPSMPSFAAVLSEAEIEAVSAYTVQLRDQG